MPDRPALPTKMIFWARLIAKEHHLGRHLEGGRKGSVTLRLYCRRWEEADLALSMYRAFISYSHAADGRLAEDLQSALHSFAKPWYQLRALRVFRDKTSLSATPGLWPEIQQALDKSEYFILLASPEAAASAWIEREIEYWLANKTSDRILVVLTDGELVWDETAASFDRGASSALPPALTDAFQQEPLWVDLRWARKSEGYSLRHSRFRDAVAELAATLHGQPKDEIAGEDVRQHRRTRRMAWSAATVLFVLAVGLAIAAWIATIQRNRAEKRSAIAQSRQLAAQAVSLAGSEQGDLALLLSIEALRIRPTVSARNALLTALTRDPRRLFHLHGHMNEVQSLAFTDNGSELLSLGCEGVGTLGLCKHFGVRRWDPRDGEPLGQTTVPGAHRWAELSDDPATGGLVVRDRQFNRWDPETGEDLGRAATPGLRSPNGKLIVRSTSQGLVLSRATTGQRIEHVLGHPRGQIRTVAFHPTASLMVTGGSQGEVRLWTIDDLLQNRFEPQRTIDAHSEAVIDLAFSPDGRHLVSASGKGAVVVWNPRTGNASQRLIQDSNISSVVFSPDGRWMVVALSIGEEGGRLQLWKPEGWRLVTTLAGKAPLAIGPNSRLLAAAGANGSVILRDLKRRRPLGHTLKRAGDPQSVAFVGERLLVAGGRRDSLRIWEVASGKMKSDPIPTEHDGVHALAAGPDGQLASGGANGRILLWDLEDSTKRPVRTLASHERTVAALDMSTDGQRLISGAFDDTLRFWEVSSGEQVRPAIDAGTDVYAVAFNHAALRAAVATEDGSILLWSLADSSGRIVGSHLLQSDGMTGLAFGPSDRFLVSSSLEQTQFWGLVPEEPEVRPPIPGAFMALHPSGKMAAVVKEGGEIQLIDVKAWRPFDATLGKQEGLVNDVAFSPDGRFLATAARGELVLWDVDLDSWQTRACRIARRNLTPREQERYLGSATYTDSCPDAPEPPQIPLNAERALGLAVRSAKLGQKVEAGQLFDDAAQLVSRSKDAELANEICWEGALHGAPDRVLEACNRAVNLEPENGHYRDSRGVARALAGNLTAAVEDFRAYVAWAQQHPDRARHVTRRQAWIDTIKAGKDPFGPLVIHRLRNEGPFF